MGRRVSAAEMAREGAPFEDIGRACGIPPGLAYLLATGHPADRSDVAPGGQQGGGSETVGNAQHLCNPPVRGHDTSAMVKEWMARRARAERGTAARARGATDRQTPARTRRRSKTS